SIQLNSAKLSINDSSTWPDYAKIDPEFEAIIRAAGGSLPKPPPGLTIQQMRQGMLDAVAKQAAAGPPPDYTGLKKSTIEIPVRDGSKIRALLYQPEQTPADGAPLVILLHPGGFAMGAPEMEEPLALELVKGHSAVVLTPSYRLAPEFPFPVGLEDAYDAVEWAASHASILNATPEKGFIVGGESAGGNLGAVISHQARDNNLSPPLTGIWLNSPAVIAPSALPEKYRDEYTSYEQNANGPLFSAAEGAALIESALKRVIELYAPIPEDPRFSPLLWPTGHKGLPRLVIQAAGLDLIRDDALIYERELREKGVQTRIHVYPGVTHAFDGMFPQLGVASTFRKDRAAGFAWLLQGN
ncbi:Alpha/Beta hydrolase protein, partial [Aspergillus karnatakaensis]|uniref:alpha/beta hydrolase n=1 Tax=Aspergillus karnatakaensis TaxID=1810916 RepID=UPI003CCD2129